MCESLLVPFVSYLIDEAPEPFRRRGLWCEVSRHLSGHRDPSTVKRKGLSS